MLPARSVAKRDEKRNQRAKKPKRHQKERAMTKIVSLDASGRRTIVLKYTIYNAVYLC